MTNAQVRYNGLAPMQARSLTVPQIDSFPIFPPGKNAGDTIKPSVDTAILPAGGTSTAASSAVRSGFAKCSLNTWSINSDVCFPPAPCAIVTVLFSIMFSFFLFHLRTICAKREAHLLLYNFIFMNTDSTQSRLLLRIPCRLRSGAEVYSLFQTLYSRMVCIFPAIHLHSDRPDLVFPLFLASDI